MTVVLVSIPISMGKGDIPNREPAVISGLQKYVTDISTLPDTDRNAINQRILEGKATPQDLLYQKEIVYRQNNGGKLPLYRSNEAHNPNSDKYGGPKKGVEPSNALQLYVGSIQDPEDETVRWTKEINGKKEIYHRFSDTNDGTYHWSGSTDAKNKWDQDVKLRLELVPITIRRMK